MRTDDKLAQRSRSEVTALHGVIRVLLVDDDRELCALLETFFVPHGLRLVARHDASGGLHAVRTDTFDLVLLDVMLPIIDGFEVLRQIRKRSAVPVILLTARTEHEDRMAGFASGADDYLPKPFNPEELLARCRALLRRATGAGRDQAISYELGGLRVNASVREAFAGDQPLHLTGTEFDVLDLLARHAGRVVTRDEIWMALYHRERGAFERVLDTHLSNLRKKLSGRVAVTIRTVRSEGYLLAVSE